MGEKIGDLRVSHHRVVCLEGLGVLGYVRGQSRNSFTLPTYEIPSYIYPSIPSPDNSFVWSVISKI